MHDLLSFCALLLGGVLGALVAEPLGTAARLVAARYRSIDR